MRQLKLNSTNSAAVEAMFPGMGMFFDYKVGDNGVSITAKINVPSALNEMPYIFKYETLVQGKYVPVQVNKYKDSKLYITATVQVKWQKKMITEIMFVSQILLKRLQQIARTYKVKLLEYETDQLEADIQRLESFEG